MNNISLRRLILPSLFAALYAVTGWALADPPSRVARLAYLSGTTSFSPGGERDWVRATVNRPMITGDRLWVEQGARAELQLGVAAIRVGAGTSITLLNLDDRTAQIQLSQGVLNVRVRRLDRGETFEIDTPNLAYAIRRPGSYRIQVDPDGRATMVTARAGSAEVYGQGRAFITAERQTYRFEGNDLRDYQTYATLRVDEFDRWASDRDRRWDNSPSRKYVSTEMIGYEDLDQNGTWRRDRTYGSVWVPNRVAADWAPYRDGHWSWVEPWGWTWIDEQPWGFAPSHYGRWAHVDSGWAWVPGPARARPVYAPALVAFVGGDGFRGPGAGGSTVGWFPLGPRDVYRPSYVASREYYSNVNSSNTILSGSVISGGYGNQVNVTYSNQQVPGAVIAVLAAAFAQSRPVHQETVRVTREMAASAPPRMFAPVAPVHTSVIGAAPAQNARPPEQSQARPVVAQVAPPPPPVPFAARQTALTANAGKPLDTAAAAAVKPAAPAVAPVITVVPPQTAVAAPPRPASAPAPAALPATAPPPAAAPAPAAPPGVAPMPPAAPGASQPGRPSRPEGNASAPFGRERPQPAPSPAATPAPATTPAPTPVPPPAARPNPPAAAAPAPAPVPVAPPAAGAPPAASAPAPRDRGNRGDEQRGARPGFAASAANERPAAGTPPPARPAFNAPPAAPPAPPTPAAAPQPAPAPEAARPAPRPPAPAPEAARPAPAPEAARAPPPAPEAARPAPPARVAPPAAAPAPAAVTPPAPARAAPPPPPAAAATPAAPPPPPPRPAGAAPPAPPPPAAAASAEQRGQPRAPGRREAASDERRKRDEEGGRKP